MDFECSICANSVSNNCKIKNYCSNKHPRESICISCFSKILNCPFCRNSFLEDWEFEKEEFEKIEFQVFEKKYVSWLQTGNLIEF